MEWTDHALPLDCLLSIFSHLRAEELSAVSGVCKEWHEAAESPWLWRQLCLQRWGFCNLGQLLSDSDRLTWKTYFLRRSRLELSMRSGRSGGDYTCRSLRGHSGRLVGFSYLVGNSSVQELWSCAPVVCSASRDGTVKAWDLQKGVSLWSTSGQTPLTSMFTDPERCLVGASDETGTIKLWSGQSGEELASFSSGSPDSTLLPFSRAGSSFLLVGTSVGSLVALSSPQLTEVSRNMICDSFKLDLLLSSPDSRWILAASKESSDLSPVVLCGESVCAPVSGADPARLNLPVRGCRAAVFLPSGPVRLVVLHPEGPQGRTALTVLELRLKRRLYREEPEAQQVESFQLEIQRHSDVILQAKGSGTLLLAVGSELKVYTLKGTLIASFKDHVQPIVSLCVDNFRVVTASRDLSLRVLTWRSDRETGLTLEGRYHLLGGSHSRSRGFTGVACDYGSIVAAVESVDGKDVLKAYVFNS